MKFMCLGTQIILFIYLLTCTSLKMWIKNFKQTNLVPSLRSFDLAPGFNFRQRYVRRKFHPGHKCHSPHYSLPCLSIRPYLGESDAKLQFISFLCSHWYLVTSTNSNFSKDIEIYCVFECLRQVSGKTQDARFRIELYFIRCLTTRYT